MDYYQVKSGRYEATITGPYVQPTTRTFAPSQVKNIVMLMLENRSLDNLLGWLYDGDQPEHVFPRDSPAGYDGLVAGRYFNPAKKWTGTIEQYPVVPVPDDLGSDLDRVPAYDP